jgi:hypothetical protein
VFSAIVDSVTVQPTRAGAQAVVISPGKEVAVTRSGASPVAPIGRAGARGGIDLEKALALVLRVVNRAARGCGFTPSHVGASVTAAGASGWKVSVPVKGKASGSAVWLVARGKATPKNAVARKIAARCA